MSCEVTSPLQVRSTGMTHDTRLASVKIEIKTNHVRLFIRGVLLEK